MLFIYLFTIWSLAANLGLTNSFPWLAGPLSNWTVWLAFALVLTIATCRLRKSHQSAVSVGEQPLEVAEAPADSLISVGQIQR